MKLYTCLTLLVFIFTACQSIPKDTATTTPDRTVILRDDITEEKLSNEDIKWKEAERKGTRDLYLSFIIEYPDSHLVDTAKERIEDIDWEATVLSDSLEDYKQYIELYPSGRYMKKAQGKISHIEELILWQDALNKGTKEAYRSFLDRYPDSEHKEHALSMIKEEEDKVIEQVIDIKDDKTEEPEITIEETNWKKAIEVDTRESYIEFIRNHPGSKYVEKAEEKIEDNLWKKSMSINNIASMEQYLKETTRKTFINEAVDRIISYYPVVLVESGSTPDGEITIESDFYIYKYEVSQKEFEDAMGFNPSSFPGEQRPVESVTLFDALLFCNKRSIADGLIPYYNLNIIQRNQNGNIIEASYKITSSNGWRLPSSAEWEYAARGGMKCKNNHFSGSNILEEVAVINAIETNETGSKIPNELGIYDMTGNVWEWTGTSQEGFYILRGGSYSSQRHQAFISFIFHAFPNSLRADYGFRIVRTKTLNY